MNDLLINPAEKSIDGDEPRILVVRDPETSEPLSPLGEYKPRNAYWLRRLADGDVLEITEAEHLKLLGAEVSPSDEPSGSGSAPRKSSRSKTN